MELARHPRIGELALKKLLARQSSELPTVDVDATVLDALKVMSEYDIGAVLVLDGRRVLGVFSERDFARYSASGGTRAEVTPIAEVMTECVTFATPANTVSESMKLLTERGLRYLPVLEDGKLIGLLSIGDLLNEVIAHQERVLKAIDLDQLVLSARGTYSC